MGLMMVMLWNDIEEDGNVRGECEKDDTDSEGGDSDTDL
jgi:hypothetical protein